MKILAIAPTFYPHMGGAERSFYELYSRLPRYGIDVDLVTPNLGGKRFEEIAKGFRVFRVGKKKRFRWAKLLFYQIYEYIKIKELLRKNKYDLVHCQYVFPNGFVGYKISKLIKKPLIFSVHHFGTGMDIAKAQQNPKLINPFMRFLLRKSNLIITTGLTQNNFLKWLFGKLPRKAITIKLGSPEIKKISDMAKNDLKKKYGFERKKVVFSIGRLNKRKRFEEIIKTAEILKNERDIVFLIAGKGEEYSNLQKLVNKKNLENIKLLGFVDDKKREDLFLISDVFAYASEFEGSGIVYTESMSYSTPVAAYENEAVKNIIKNDNFGFVVKRNPKELANAILRLIKDKKLSDKIVKNCYDLIKKEHNWEIYAEKYAREFKKINKERNIK